MRHYRALRIYARARKLTREIARRCAVGVSAVAGLAWWVFSTIATSGAGLLVTGVAVVLSTFAAAFCWLWCGERSYTLIATLRRCRTTWNGSKSAVSYHVFACGTVWNGPLVCCSSSNARSESARKSSTPRV